MDEETTLPDVDPGETAEPTDEVETEAPAPSEETTDEAPAEQPKKPPKGVQKRLDEITRLRYEAERRAEQERQERLYWQQKALGETPKQPVATNKPSVDQYQTYEDYLEALSDWKVEQRLTKERAEAEERQQQESKVKKAQTYAERVQSARDKYEDYDHIAHGSHWSPSQEMADAIMESDNGPDIAYYLGNNPDEAQRISRLSSTAQIRELGRLEERLSKPPPAPKPTKAPEPIKPAGSPAKADKDPADMSPSEFSAWRKKYIAQRR